MHLQVATTARTANDRAERAIAHIDEIALVTDVQQPESSAQTDPESADQTTDMSSGDRDMRITELGGRSNIEVLEIDGKRLVLVGTAHVSKASVEEVRDVIRTVRPDAVCVELCAARYKALTDKDQWKNLDIFKVIREGKTLFLLANLAVGAYQRRLGQELGVKPGAELLAAADAAAEVGAELCLVDRDIHVTLKRTWGNIGFWKKGSMLAAIMASLFPDDEDEDTPSSAQQIEALKDADNLSTMMDEFAEAFPEVKEPLIDERDRFMISHIRETPGDVVVGVVGAAHLRGMVANIDTPIDRKLIDVLPQPAVWTKALKWVIPIAVLAAFAWGISRNDGRSVQEMLYAWALPNAIVAAVLTAIAGGKLGSIFVAFIGSPITSLNPLINTGFLVGFTEAWLRKPTVEDAERINEDVQSFKGLMRNPFTRVLVVSVAATIGSALGALIGATLVMRLVAG